MRSRCLYSHVSIGLGRWNNHFETNTYTERFLYSSTTPIIKKNARIIQYLFLFERAKMIPLTSVIGLFFINAEIKTLTIANKRIVNDELVPRADVYIFCFVHTTYIVRTRMCSLYTCRRCLTTMEFFAVRSLPVSMLAPVESYEIRWQWNRIRWRTKYTQVRPSSRSARRLINVAGCFCEFLDSVVVSVLERRHEVRSINVTSRTAIR